MNFLWAYANEAHPEEYPFASGFETRDLGWEHRYFEPLTMAERAQRARWMKAELEPDAEIPMIIDYINSSMGPDNAIWEAYTGGGFYAGFVIDCDAKLVYQEGWAWRAPGGQWWGLPLAPLAELEDFLDRYLAGPSPCYEQPVDPPEPEIPARGESGATVLIVDDDGGSNYEGYFKMPLSNLKIHHELWDTEVEGSPPAEVLEAYNVIVWFTGDEDRSTLTATDQANLTAYLDGGGKLFISGQDIGQDIGETEFYNRYLHATLIADDAGLDSVIGADILSDIEVSLTGFDGAGNQDSPSRIGLSGGAVGVFRYDTLFPATWAGLRWEGDYSVVYFAFGFEGIADRGAATFRYEIMKKIFAWFDELPCHGDIDFDEDVDLDDYKIMAGSLAGPNQTEVPPGVDFTQFAKADLDLDEDVDLADFADFQRRFGVPCR